MPSASQPASQAVRQSASHVMRAPLAMLIEDLWLSISDPVIVALEPRAMAVTIQRKRPFLIIK